MIYRGTIRDGVVILPEGVSLPDGLEVAVQPVLAQPVQDIPPNWRAAMRNGVPVFPPDTTGTTPGLELVNELRDETP